MDCEKQKSSCVSKYLMPFIITMGFLIGLVGIALIVVFFAIEEQDNVGTEAPSRALYENAKSHLRNVIDRPLIGTVVRLTFHDCIGPDGCDGCLNLNTPDNAGLGEIRKILVDERQKGFKDISNADFWQIAGIIALEKANPKLSLTFKGGRQDCPRSPEDDADHGYPNPVMNHTEMIDYFRGTEFGFNMTEQQTTALNGVHALGRAHKGNSGYSHPWTPDREHVLDNELYRLLLENGTQFINKANKKASSVPQGTDLKYQWTLRDSNTGKTFMMLNTDMELAYDIDVDNTGKGTQCKIGNGEDESRCLKSSTHTYVAIYANDENAFLDDFKDAYELMMTAKIKDNLTVPH